MGARVSVPASRLGDVLIPDVNSEIGSKSIIVYAPAEGVRIEKEGFVYRLESELDRQTRTAYLLVAIDNPLEGSGIPLLPGAYVDVILQGRTHKMRFRSQKVHFEMEIMFWLPMNKINSLAKTFNWDGWMEKSSLLSGLKPGDRVITTAIGFHIWPNLIPENDK